MGDEEDIFRTAVSFRGPFGVNNGRFELMFKSAHGRSKLLATPGDPYMPLLPCRFSHGIQAVCYVRTLVAV